MDATRSPSPEQPEPCDLGLGDTRYSRSPSPGKKACHPGDGAARCSRSPSPENGACGVGGRTTRHSFQEAGSSAVPISTNTRNIMVREEDISYIVGRISTCAHKWREICSQCGLPPNELDEIENELKYFLGGNNRYLTEGLRAWCKISPRGGRGHRKKPRFSVLIKALRSTIVGEGVLAEELSKNHYNLPSVKTENIEGVEQDVSKEDKDTRLLHTKGEERDVSEKLEEDKYTHLLHTKGLFWKLLLVTIIAAFTLIDTCTTPICKYQLHLKSHYKNYPIAPFNKWPPTLIDEYINLTLVVQDNRRSRDEFIGHKLHGNIKQIVDSRQEISIDQIFQVDGSHDQKKSSLILVEGAPGIGKSIFAWELCRKWAEDFSSLKQYSLVILLRLREEEVQSITKVSDLFYSIGNDVIDKQSLVEEVSKNQGSGILFVLDGFDELPKKQQENGFLLNLISRKYFPQSTVLVTSRPSATATLLTKFRPRVIEILGFTQESVEAYAGAIFSADKLEAFKSYISASNNPAINSLMYIPLNAAIVVQIYLDTKSVSMLPHTLTELYTQLCLTNLKRHYPWLILKRLEDLPPNLYEHLLDLSEVAFKGLEDDQVIFDSIPSDLDHFGFLDAEPALYGAGVSYNFLHLTLQEFFAAYHISQLEDGLEILKQYGGHYRWNVVWRFVAGLTKFEHFDLTIDDYFFVYEDASEKLSQLFIQCLFEAQTVMHLSFLNTDTIGNFTAVIEDWSSFDMYALGYSARFLPANLPLHITFYFSSNVRHFILGLENVASNEQSNLVPCIATLNLIEIKLSNMDWIHLSELIPHMTCLKVLEISGSFTVDEGISAVLQQLFHSTVTELTIDSTYFNKNLNDPSIYSAFSSLVLGRLEKLDIFIVADNDELFMTLFDRLNASSSLKSLSLYYEDKYHGSNWTALINNTCLTTLEINLPYDGYNMTNAVSQLAELLRHNKVLLYLHISVPSRFEEVNGTNTIIDALRENKTLQGLEVEMAGLYDYCDIWRSKYMKPDDIIDLRITWKCNKIL